MVQQQVQLPNRSKSCTPLEQARFQATATEEVPTTSVWGKATRKLQVAHSVPSPDPQNVVLPHRSLPSPAVSMLESDRFPFSSAVHEQALSLNSWLGTVMRKIGEGVERLGDKTAPKLSLRTYQALGLELEAVRRQYRDGGVKLKGENQLPNAGEVLALATTSAALARKIQHTVIHSEHPMDEPSRVSRTRLHLALELEMLHTIVIPNLLTEECGRKVEHGEIPTQLPLQLSDVSSDAAYCFLSRCTDALCSALEPLLNFSATESSPRLGSVPVKTR